MTNEGSAWSPPLSRDAKSALAAMTDDERWRVMTSASGQAYVWVEAVLRQAERVFDPANTTVDHMAEAVLFVLALRNVLRSAALAAGASDGEVRGRIADAISQFEAAAPDAKDLRDALDHFDDYAVGVGRNERASTQVFYERTPDTYTVIVGDLRIDVGEVRDAALALATAVMIEPHIH